MKHKVMALAAVFAATLAASAVMEGAEARRGGGGGRSHARSFSAPHFHGHRSVRVVPTYPRRRAYINTGPGYYSGGCAWIRQRALATGSRYWWQRYYACRSGLAY